MFFGWWAFVLSLVYDTSMICKKCFTFDFFVADGGTPALPFLETPLPDY